MRRRNRNRGSRECRKYCGSGQEIVWDITGHNQFLYGLSKQDTMSFGGAVSGFYLYTDRLAAPLRFQSLAKLLLSLPQDT